MEECLHYYVLKYSLELRRVEEILQKHELYWKVEPEEVCNAILYWDLSDFP